MNEIIDHFLKMKNVERMQGTFKLRPYNLMEHSYAVTALFIEMSKREGIEITVQDITDVISHDLLETQTGDLIWSVKHFSDKTLQAWDVIEDEILDEFPELKYTDNLQLDSVKHRLFKACDNLDLWIFCMQEQEFGNDSRAIRDIISNCEMLIENRKFDSVGEYMKMYREKKDNDSASGSHRLRKGLCA